MKDIPSKRILRYTIAAFLVMVLTAYGFGVGIASAESGSITVQNSSNTQYVFASVGGLISPVYTTLYFDSSDYQSVVNYTLTDSYPNLFSYGQQSEVTSFVITSGGTGSGVASYSAALKHLNWVFTPTTQLTSSTVVLSYTTNIFANVTALNGRRGSGVGPSVTKPICMAASDGSCITEGTNTAVHSAIGVASTVTNTYIVTYPIAGFFQINISKSGQSVSTKDIIHSATQTYQTETSFNTNGFSFFGSQLDGIYLNVTMGTGDYLDVLINSTSTPTTGIIPTTSISLNRTIVPQNTAFNYTITLQNADTSSSYYLALVSMGGILGYIDFGTSSTIVGTRSYNIGGLAEGTYYLTLYATGYGALSSNSLNFTAVPAFSTDFDNIHTSKATYNLGESQLIYGYATSPAQIKIYSGATLVSNKGTYTGVFNITANMGTGRYLVNMERNVGGHISIITSVSYTVANDNTSAISINMVDPGTFDCGSCFSRNTIDRRFAIGNTVGGSDGGQMITVNYNRKNNNDTVYIYNPQGIVFDSWIVNTYTTWLTSREFYVPNEYSSIGIWTAKIVDATNASNFSISTLTAFVYDNYVNNADSVGNAVIQTTNNNPCAGTSIGISWTVTNLSEYAVRIYREGDNTLLFNDTYTSSTGSIIVTLNSASSTYYFKIMNSTTFQTINQISINTKSQSECAAAANANATTTPQTGNWTATQTDVTRPCQFWDGWVGFMGMGINDISRFQFALLIIGLITVISVAATKNIGIGVTMGFFPYAFFLYLSLSTSCGTYIPTWTAVFIALIIGIKLRWFS